MPHTVEKEFTFCFGSRGQACRLTVPVTVPLSSSPSELVGRLQTMHNLPCYITDGKTELSNALYN